MKKLLALILAALCCLGMFACGGEDNSKTLDDAISILNNLYKDTTRTPADYDLVASVKVGEKSVSVTWTVSLDTIKVVESDKKGFYTVDVPSANETETTYVLKATVKMGKQSKSKEFTITLPVIDPTAAIGNPEEGKAYKFYMNQVNLGKLLFLTTEGSDSKNKYIKGTENAAEAPDYFAEKVDGGYKFYTTVDGAKKYLTGALIIEEGNTNKSKYLRLTDEGCVWYYKADCNAWFTKLDGGEYVVGTYNDFNTFSISDGKYMTPDKSGVSQFPCVLVPADAADKLKPAEKPEGPELPAADSTLTIAQIIDLAAEMTSNVYSEGKYYVVGEITEIYNEQYGNMKIKDANGNILTIYGTYSADGATRFDALETKPAVGDTIKVYGVIGQYNGTPQVKNGWIIEITPAA